MISDYKYITILYNLVLQHSPYGVVFFVFHFIRFFKRKCAVMKKYAYWN